MTHRYAYRASDQLAAVLRTWKRQFVEFHETVVLPWEETHFEVTSVWARRFGVDPECVGFTLTDQASEVPAGLSRNRERVELIPKRGKAGDPWRQAMDQFNQRPLAGNILRDHEVIASFLVPDAGRFFTAGMWDTGELGYFLSWGYEHPKPGPHLTLVALSVFYTAVETAGLMDKTGTHDVVNQPIDTTR